MVIERVDERTYKSVIDPNLSHVFNSAAFNTLNAKKCDSVHYLLFREGKYRLGIILGQRGDTFLSPFSAPFGGFEAVRTDVQIQYIENAIELLKSYVTENNGAHIQLTLPPLFYDQSVIAKTINSLYRLGFSLNTVDVNHAIELASWKSKMIKRQSNFEGMSFQRCSNVGEKNMAYEIIRENRKHRGYPLRMTKDQVMETVKLLDADFFMASTPDGLHVASALVYHLSKNIVQVIYWGNLPDFDHFRPMNFLALNLISYYKNLNVSMIDIGPSSENSIPNYGLCDFKERIGCCVHPKFSFIWNQPSAQ